MNYSNQDYISIVDYGMGNLRSVQKALNKLGTECRISSDPEIVKNACKLILPGVGHFSKGMQNLREYGLIDILRTKVLEEGTPFLGICLGTQLLASHSEEGDCEGLGWIDATVKRFQISDPIRFKVPHIGWNSVSIAKSNQLDSNLSESDQFYFVHSYHLHCGNDSDIWMTSEYEYEFVSAIRRENIFGTQFHPEKSHDAGFTMLKNFVEL